jgi:hypothetical protein
MVSGKMMECVSVQGQSSTLVNVVLQDENAKLSVLASFCQLHATFAIFVVHR